jgi:glycine/D-amino acid oxidase-like deaminating enzyme
MSEQRVVVIGAGMIGAPNTGRIIAGMVCEQPLNVDASAFRAERFS